MAKKRAKRRSASNPWPERLRELRRLWGDGERSLIQKEAAKRLGTSLRSLAGWEGGEQIPARPVQILIDLMLEQARMQ